MPQSTKEILMGHATSSLFTGINGSGKTVAAGSYPGPIYFFDFDGRMAPLKKMFPDRDDIFYDTYLSFERANTRMKEWMRNGPDLSPLGIPYKTIVADSLTTVSKTILKDQKKLRGSNKNQQGTIQIAEISDYNYETSGLEDLVSFLITMKEDYKIHAILTAHLIAWDAAIPGKENIGRTEIKTQILTAGKKVAPFIPCVFDECYYFETESSTEGVARYAYTEDWAGNSAKSALPLPRRIDFTNKSFYGELVKALAEHGISLETSPESRVET